jgi:hypothetical protein
MQAVNSTGIWKCHASVPDRVLGNCPDPEILATSEGEGVWSGTAKAKPDPTPPDEAEAADLAEMQETWAKDASTHSRSDTAKSMANRVRTLYIYVTNPLHLLFHILCYVTLYEYVIVIFLPGE